MITASNHVSQSMTAEPSNELLTNDGKPYKKLNEMLVIMKNVMNDHYARDTSEKIKAVKKSTFQTGKYIGAYAPIGHMKSPEDKHKLIPDPATAPIVRKIFALRCEGRSFRNIALILNAEGIPTPRDLYYQSIGKENPRNENPYWSGTTVKTILRNEVYIGNMVQNKTGHPSYKIHKQVAKPQEEWIRVEHTHEPLVSMETWELVRSLDEKPTRRRTMNNGKMALFAGVVFCMDCGSVMQHDYETRPRKSGKKSTYESYLCSRYSFSGKNACSAHVISQRALIQLVLTDVHLKASCAKQDP